MYLSNFFLNLPVYRPFIKKAVKIFLQLPRNRLRRKLYKKNFMFFRRLRFSKRLPINFYKFYYLKFRYLHKKISNFTIRQRLMLTAKNVYKSLWYFFFKATRRQSRTNLHLIFARLKKKSFKYIKKNKKRNRVIFLNAHKSLVAKMRRSRYAH